MRLYSQSTPSQVERPRLRYFLFSCLFTSNVWAVGLYTAPKQHDNDVKASPVPADGHGKEAAPNSSCTQAVTPADEKFIGEFLAKSSELRKNLSAGSSLDLQLNKLIEDYSKKISPAGLSALSAVYMREQFLQLANGLQNDPSVNKAYSEFNTASEQRIAERDRYKNAGFFKRVSGSADKAIIDSGNNVTAKMNALIASLKSSSKLDEAYKQQIVKSLLKMQMAESAADGDQAAAIANRYAGYAATAKTVRNGAVGAGLIVGGILTGGATMSAGASVIASTTATLGTSGAVTVGLLSSAAVGAAAGAAGGAGYGLLRGEAGMIARSTLGDDSFMCSLVQEQAQHSQQVYKDALKFAAMGAAIGGVAGGLSAAGGIYALIAQGGGATLATVGAGASAWGATKQGLESKALFEKAAQASAQGDEASARTLVNQARAKAVDAGLSGVDTVLAGVAAAKTSQAFKQSLKEAPQSIAQLAEAKSIALRDSLLRNEFEQKASHIEGSLKAKVKNAFETLTAEEKQIFLKNFSRFEKWIGSCK